MDTKKTIYLIAAMVLGLLIALIVRAELELWYIKKILLPGANPISYGAGGFVPPLTTFVLAIGGLLFGYVIGQRWWQMVYVEKRHWRWRKK